jgi:hypothetical protein
MSNLINSEDLYPVKQNKKIPQTLVNFLTDQEMAQVPESPSSEQFAYPELI